MTRCTAVTRLSQRALEIALGQSQYVRLHLNWNNPILPADRSKHLYLIFYLESQMVCDPMTQGYRCSVITPQAGRPITSPEDGI
jgi:hypothetical protein